MITYFVPEGTTHLSMKMAMHSGASILVIPDWVRTCDDSIFFLFREIHLMHSDPKDAEELECGIYGDEPSGFLTDAWANPDIMDEGSYFEDFDFDSVKLYVPDESVELYKNHGFFCEFYNILPESASPAQTDENHTIERSVFPYDFKSLQECINQNIHYEYLFFWGHTSKSNKITKACLSQWYPCSFVVNNTRYSSAEQYMMAEKARIFHDESVRKQILASNNPKEIKALGRKVHNFNAKKWEEYSYDIVKSGNIAKFSQNPSLLEFLFRTSGKILVEASPYDDIWGIGMAESERAKKPDKWTGTNKLGFALTEVREILLSEIGKTGNTDPCIPVDNKTEASSDTNILLFGDSTPTNGCAIIFAGGSSSGKSTLIKKMDFKGEVLSTDTLGESLMNIHNNAKWYAEHEPEEFEFAEKIVKAGLYTRFPNPRLLNKVPNLHLDFATPTVTSQSLSALLSNGAHRYKKHFFLNRIDECSRDGKKNIILDMTGKEREVNLYYDYLRSKGYKVALVWVVTNRSIALLWNNSRRRAMKVSGVHAGHKGPNEWLLDGLMDGRCNRFDDVWIIFNSTESIRREMTSEEKEHSILHLTKQEGHYVIDTSLAERIMNVLGPLEESVYVKSAWMKNFFLRYRIICKVAIENGISVPEAKEFLVSFEEKDRKECEDNIQAFYNRLGVAEPTISPLPCECYDVNEPIAELFANTEEYEEAVKLYSQQKEQYLRSVKEWEEFEKQFEPNLANKESIEINDIKTVNKKTDTLSFKYDFEKNPIEKYSKKIQDIVKTINKVEESDISPLVAFFQKVKTQGRTICFYGAGGAASPSTFASQLANEEGIVAITLTPMAVMTLNEEVVKKMCFLAISASGGPVDMQAATEYLMSIAPEQVYCLTTNPLDHKNRFGHLDNKVGLMVKSYSAEHAICVNLSVHSDGFVGTNKHVGLSLLLYRAFHPEETGFAEKLLLPDVEPYETRLPEDMSLKDISDLHVLYGVLGRSAANDMEGRMLEAGVVPAMATDFKNFTHGRHVFLDKHPHSTILMLISPRDEAFVNNMLDLIPQERPIIFIRTKRNDMLGALQLMICTFYLSIDICAPLNINAYSPGAPKWGGKMWALKIKLK